MNRILNALLIFLFSLALPGTLEAQDFFDAGMVTGDFNFEPGKVHYISFKISNVSDQPQRIVPEVIYPEGVKPAVPLLPVQIAPGESRVVIVSLSIPSSLTAGKYPLPIVFKSESGQVRSFGPEITVKEREGLTLELLESPEFVMGGDKINAVYLLKNTGNNRRRILLEAYNCDLTSTFVTLDPGESVSIQASAETSKYIEMASSHGFSVRAVLSEATAVRSYQNVRVFPLKEAEADLWFRYPVTLSARYLSRGREGNYSDGYQLEAFGKGFLDTEKKHEFEFLARGPNNYELSFLGLYDEYYVSYKNERFNTFWGSKSYMFTPLTESARYGMGTENIYISKGGNRLGFLYVQPRFYRDINHEMAGFADIAVVGKNRIETFLIAKQFRDMDDYAMIGSVTTHLFPFRGTTAELEYSYGSYLDVPDHAFRAQLQSQFKFLSLSGNYFYAGKDYPGYYNHTSFYNGNLNVRLSKALSVSVSAREDFSNAALDTLYYSAPWSRMLQSSINYRISQSLEFRTFYMSYERKDRMPVKQFDYSTQSLNAWLNHNISKFSYQLWGELGKTENALVANADERVQDSYRGSLTLGYRPTYQFYMRAFTSYSNVNTFISSSQRNWLWGFSASGKLARNLSTSVQVQNSYAIEEYYRNRNLFQFSLDYRFLKKHRLSLNSFYTLFQNQTEKPDYSASLTYAVEIGIPLKKTGEAGTVAGVLTGQDGTPLADKLVFLSGRSAVTDESGNFEFRNVAPGRYFVTIDRSRLGMNEILNIPSPVHIEVLAEEETRLHLGLVNAARINGRFAIRENGTAILPGDAKAPQIGNIVVDLKSELESHRMISKPDGTFEFPQLRPGKWTLQIYANTIDQRYRTDNEYLQFELTQGEQKELVIDLVPRVKNIIFRNVQVNASPAKESAITLRSPDAGKEEIQKEPEGIWYSVQIASARGKVNMVTFPGEIREEIFERYIDGRYKYFTGRFSDVKDARRYRDQVRRRIPGAFTVAFRGNAPIPLSEAIR